MNGHLPRVNWRIYPLKRHPRRSLIQHRVEGQVRPLVACRIRRHSEDGISRGLAQAAGLKGGLPAIGAVGIRSQKDPLIGVPIGIMEPEGHRSDAGIGAALGHACPDLPALGQQDRAIHFVQGHVRVRPGGTLDAFDHFPL